MVTTAVLHNIAINEGEDCLDVEVPVQEDIEAEEGTGYFTIELRILEWPAQPADLNPIDNLWTDIETVFKEKPRTQQQESRKFFELLYILSPQNAVNNWQIICHDAGKQ
ncbi:hypothetical protein Trydic_g12923 [Trypoxylus dichotomus]